MKRQKYLRTMLYKNSQSDDSTFNQTSLSSEGCTSRSGMTSLEITVSIWKDVWYSKFDWIEFDCATGRIFMQSL